MAAIAIPYAAPACSAVRVASQMHRDDFIEELSWHITDRLVEAPGMLQSTIIEGRSGLKGLTNAQLREAAAVWQFEETLED
jgi:hypothetical protein